MLKKLHMFLISFRFNPLTSKFAKNFCLIFRALVKLLKVNGFDWKFIYKGFCPFRFCYQNWVSYRKIQYGILKIKKTKKNQFFFSKFDLTSEMFLNDAKNFSIGRQNVWIFEICSVKFRNLTWQRQNNSLIVKEKIENSAFSFIFLIFVYINLGLSIIR